MTWEGSAYEPSATHHRVVDDWFLAAHAPRPTDVVVDAGSGTGEFTARLAELAADGTVIGVEPDPSMLARAQEKAGPNLSFRQGRLQELDRVVDPGSADLVVSRAVFHWISLADYPRCYQAIHRVLRPGGVFHAESGGAGNVPKVVEVMDQVAARHGLRSSVTFPDAGTALELLEQAGFDAPEGGVTTVAQRRSFDRESLIAFLRAQAAVAFAGDADDQTREEFVGEVLDRVDDFRRHDGSFDQTFVRLHVLCRKPT